MAGKGITQDLLKEEILRQEDMRELFSFYDALLTARRQILQDLPPVVPADEAGAGEFAKALNEERYAASVAGPKIDPDDFAGAFQKMAAVVAKKAPHLAKAARFYAQLDPSTLPPFDPAAIGSSGLVASPEAGPAPEEPTRKPALSIPENPEDPEGRLFRQLYTNAVQPFFEKFALELALVVEEVDWHQAYCPVCGSRPAMAQTTDDGARDLYCTFCGTKRHYPRLACPHCENTDHEQLRYMEISEKPQYRIDVCEDCKGYVKVLVQSGDSESESFNPFVADILTLHLDVLAQKHGYSPTPEHSAH